MENTSNVNRIAKNTLMLYFRQILILFVSLFTVRVVLNTLGAEDYGIYGVVGGVVSFFSFLSGTMASATQRFFSFALGQKNQERLNKTFSVNFIIYCLIAFIAVVLLETIGSWFVCNKMNVPADRFDAAVWVFHFSIMSFVVSIFSSPFMAIIIAHEDMQIYAYVSIIEALLKLLVVFLLKIILFDKLKVYGVLLFFVGLINATIYILICIKRYDECQFKHFYWDKDLFKKILSFTGWTLFGNITSVGRNQAVTILINQFFNPLVVSARTIATQIANYINMFSNNFNTGLYPPIIKAYANDDKDTMFDLIFYGCKITFFLMWIFALPLFLEMDYVLTFWLKNPPENAILFTRLSLIEVLITAISLPIMTAARAPGKMKTYELTLGCLQIVIFITDFVLFKYFGAAAYIVFVVAAIVNLMIFVVRLLIVHRLIGLPLRKYFKKVICPILLIMIISSILSFLISYWCPVKFGFEVLSVLCSFVISSLSMFFIGLGKKERIIVMDKIKNRIGRKK